MVSIDTFASVDSPAIEPFQNHTSAILNINCLERYPQPECRLCRDKAEAQNLGVVVLKGSWPTRFVDPN